MAYTKLPATDGVTTYDAARDGHIQDGIVDADAAATANTAALAGKLSTTDTAADSTKVGGVTISGTPATGHVPTATSATTAAWTAPSAGAGDATTSTKGVVQLAGDLGGTAASPTVPGLAAKATDSAVVHNTGTETVAGVKTFTASPIVPTPTTSTQAAPKGYVDSVASAGAADATTGSKGIVQLAGDLGGTAASPTVPGLSGKASTSTTVSAGTGLTGGGDLSTNRTFAVAYGTTSGTAAQGNDSRITGAAQRTGGNTFTGAQDFTGATVSGVTGGAIDGNDVGYDVILAAGQSNMWGQSGATPVPATLDVSSPRIWQYGQNGSLTGVISLAIDPLLMPLTSGAAPTGMGPALTFARWYASSIPSNRLVLIVPVAVGNTDIATSWNPTGSGNLYTGAITTCNAAIAAAGANSRLAGIIWLQGESDSIVSYSGANYQTKLDLLIAGWRASIATATSATPFVLCGMVPELTNGTAADIRAVHADTPNRVFYTGYFAGPAGASLGDTLHYSAAGQRVNGRGMFTAFRSALTNVPPTGVPAQVINLSGTATGGQVSLAWTAPAALPVLTDYLVEYKLTSSGTWLTFADGTSTTPTCVVTGLTNGSSYDFRISGINALGTGTASATFSATPVAFGGFSQDTFTGANGTVLTAHTGEVGATWTKSSGTNEFTLNGAGVAVAGAGGGFTCWYTSGVPGSADYATTMDITGSGSGADTEFGVSVRASTSAITRYNLLPNASGIFILSKFVAGTITVLATAGAGMVTGTTYRLTLTATGTTITGRIQRLSDNFYLATGGVWQAGAANALTVTDSAISATGRAGLLMGGANIAGSTIDNFSAT